jgi:hypothetical protein
MNLANASVAVGIVGSVVTIASVFVAIFKGAKDFRLPVMLAIVTVVAVGIAYFSLPPNNSEITSLREEIARLSRQNTQIMQLIMNFVGGMPTKEQLDELVAMVAEYKGQIADLRARIAKLSPNEATQLRSQLAEMERTLERVDFARAQYENLIGLPAKLAGTWVLMTPLAVSKFGGVDGLEFFANGRVRYLEHGKPATWYGTSSRYSLINPLVLRLLGNSDSLTQDYALVLEGDSVVLREFGGKGEFRGIRVSPGPSDLQVKLTDDALNGRWRGTPEDCRERDGTRVLAISISGRKATFGAYYPAWDQDVYNFDRMQSERYESDYRITDERHVLFSAFAGKTSPTSWRAQVYGRLLILQAESDSSRYAFTRY